jgi:hypothetical protein
MTYAFEFCDPLYAVTTETLGSHIERFDYRDVLSDARSREQRLFVGFDCM